MWIIKHPFTSYARVEFTSQEVVADPVAASRGDRAYDSYDEAAHVAYNMRCSALNPPSRTCAFCGGPTPCLRD